MLGLTVLIFRTFVAEGYLISTGSMAPSLLGYHRHVACDFCHYTFRRGASPQEQPGLTSSDGELAAANGPTADFVDVAESRTCCPLCGSVQNSVKQFPRNEGDQLLVHKHAYQFRDPRRWEVIVFRNPSDPRQAYVKRVAGLPGEEIEIRDGNVFANGELQRKPYEVVRSVRIPVADSSYEPAEEDPNWNPRWQPRHEQSGWKRFGSSFTIERTPAQPAGIDWLVYRHWIRSGGEHITQVRLDAWPADVEHPRPSRSPLDYDEERQRLRCTGALSAEDRDEWLAATDDETFHAAIRRIFERSHIAPITDQYGYNARGLAPEHHVPELMVEVQLAQVTGDGHFQIAMHEGRHEFTVDLDFGLQTFELLVDDDAVPVRKGSLPAAQDDGSRTLEFGIVDQQVLLAIDATQICPPFAFEPDASRSRRESPPVKVGAADLDLELTHLRLYRDLYYTEKSSPSGSPYVLADDQFFVLGDNSPVSVDSRVWTAPAVPRSAFIGKPVVVHLPSKQGRVSWAGQEHFIRMPDLTRIRYIR